MAKTMNFDQIADQKLESVERPPLPPAGEYTFAVSKIPSIADMGTQWQKLTFPLRAVRPMESVDPDAMAAFGDVKNVQVTLGYIFDKEDENSFNKTLFQVRRFLEDHIKCADPQMSIKQALAASVNQVFIGTVTWKADKEDAELFHANVTRTAPAD